MPGRIGPEHGLRWTESRWHLHGRPIHAGTVLEVRADHPDEAGARPWSALRIESRDAGRVIFLVTEAHGIEFTRELTISPSAGPPLVRAGCPMLRWRE